MRHVKPVSMPKAWWWYYLIDPDYEEVEGILGQVFDFVLELVDVKNKGV